MKSVYGQTERVAGREDSADRLSEEGNHHFRLEGERICNFGSWITNQDALYRP